MDNKCVTCGVTIPEGRHICYACEKKANDKKGCVWHSFLSDCSLSGMSCPFSFNNQYLCDLYEELK